MHHKTVFLDRDGVINKDIGYLYESKYFEFVDGIIDVCKYLLENNFSLIVITNQSGIARGFYKEQKFLELNEWMLKEFHKRDIEILDVFYCPHGPEDNCLCRKPRPGMFINAVNKYDINTKESWMVGDKEDDIIAANNAGISNTVLLKSDYVNDNSTSKASHKITSLKEIKKIIK